MTLHKCAAGALLFALASTLNAAEAATVTSVTGNFTADDDVFTTTVSIATAGYYRFESWSYAGGTMSDGTVVAAGGFDIILSLFDATGELLGFFDDGADRIDPATGTDYDSAFNIALDPGDYTLAITQFNNFPTGSNLADGFDRQGEGNFTPGLEALGLPCTASSFCDISGTSANARTSFFAVDVTSVPAPVPLPPALLLMGASLASLGLRRRRSAV